VSEEIRMLKPTQLRLLLVVLFPTVAFGPFSPRNVYAASSITVIVGANGTGTQDANLTADGQILFADPDLGGNTLSTGALASIAATTNIIVQATSTITFNDLGGTLTLQTALGKSVTFSTATGGGGAITFLTTTNTLATSGGSINFSAGTNLTVGNLNTNGGDVSLTAGTAAAGNVSAQSIITAGSGNLTFSATNAAGGTITQTGNAIGQAINVTATGDIAVDSLRGTIVTPTSNTGSISSLGANAIQASSQLTLAAATGIIVNTLSAGLTASNSTSGNINVTQAASPAQALTITGGGVVNSVSGGGISITNLGSSITINGGANVTSTNGAVILAALDLQINGAVNSGTAPTTLANSTAGRQIDLGTNTAGTIGLTQLELNNVTAAVLRVGSGAAGSITVSAAITNPATWNTLVLISNGPITEAAAGSLALPNLSVSSTGPVTLTSANNIGTLAADTANAFSFSNSTHQLNVGVVAGDTGIATSSSDIHLIADDMNIAQQVTTSSSISGDVTLEPFTASETIDLGTNSANHLGLTNTELNHVTAGGALRIGTGTSAGNITVSAAITQGAGYNTLALKTGGNISGGGGSLAVNNLIFTDTSATGRAYDLNNATSGANSFKQGASIAIPYSLTTGLTVNAGAGSDTFNVTPSSTTTFSIVGGLPDPPASPGDVLNVDLTGTTNGFLTKMSTPTGLQGSYTFGNRQPVNFLRIETLSPSLSPCSATFPENFDGVTAPALPGGWTTAATGGEAAWVTSTTNHASAPNDAFAPDVSTVGNTELFTPIIAGLAANGTLTFQNSFNMETGYDGMVLEISIDGGPFADIITAGGIFVTGGYTGTIQNTGSPIAGRMAWTGLSGGSTTTPAYITTTVNLPAAANGKDVQFKWRAATDVSMTAMGNAGVRIDNIAVSCATPTPTPTATATATATATSTPTPIPLPTPTSTPTPTPIPIPTPTPTPSATPTPKPGSLGNISTRLQVGTGNNVLFAGFIIQGNASKTVLIRSAGPSLTAFGLPGAMSDPQLELHDANNLIGMNDNWQTTQLGGVITSDQVAAIQNSGAAPADPAEPAIIATLPAGGYTAIVQGVGGTQGVATVEVYDLSPNNGATLANISTRGFIQTGDNVMIGGFIIVGNSSKVLIRATGPSLIPFGINNALANPQLELHDANGRLAGNDDWQTTQINGIITSDQSAAIQNSGLAPGNPLESAIIATLPPGGYTAIAQGVNGGTGVGLVEVFALP
jgi:outer membrane biosynthesis protein TonB